VHIADVIASGQVRTVFQPIVDLDAGQVVAYEALSRGPEGALERPDLLFAAARENDLLGELDALCRASALRNAIGLNWPSELALFVNVEPQVLDVEPLDTLIELAAAAPGGLQVVLEITERAISARPAELLSCVRKLRHAGWRIALDDVGADDMSLAFMPLLQPDIVKLDLKLVQDRPGPAVAQIMNAVNAYAHRTGALLLAEGIEDERHLDIARALGARLGQGWMFGRPAAHLQTGMPTGVVSFAERRSPTSRSSPFECLPAGTALRRSTKPLLVELSKHLEREALAHGSTCVVVSTFQYAEHFTPKTAERYRRLAERLGFVAAIGEGLPAEPVAGVRGAAIDAGDALRDEWDLIVLAPHFSAALLARDLGDTGPDAERHFEFALSYERSVVSAAAEALLSRVAPVETAREPAVLPAAAPEAAPAMAPRAALSALEHSPDAMFMLQRALAATTNGVTIADVTRPDCPLVYVNAAFERLSGLTADQVIGTNCRVLQGPDTDPAAIARIRKAIAEGVECRETLLNYRHGGEPWWNEVFLAPITDEHGRVVQYIGVQNDVTARVVAELELENERARSRAYLAEMESLAYNDPLTGLLNRRQLPELLARSIDDARADGTSIGLLYLDVDNFKAINDSFGHAKGDELLRRIAATLREDDQLGLRARIGGDEFLVVLVGLRPVDAALHTMRVAAHLDRRLRGDIGGRAVTVSIGTSTFPDDGADFDALLHAADRRMYDIKSRAEPA
jgi:diguanylate cyclase (GGDEF)-like protein/PAS domain S-box-containing protein